MKEEKYNIGDFLIYKANCGDQGLIGTIIQITKKTFYDSKISNYIFVYKNKTYCENGCNDSHFDFYCKKFNSKILLLLFPLK